MPLNLKRTPAEKAEREWRKAQKAARKAAKRSARRAAYDGTHGETHGEGSRSGSTSPSHKRRRKSDVKSGEGARFSSHYDGGYSSDEPEYGPPPPPSGGPSSWSTSPSHEADYASIRAEIEERRFREKMFDALADDERLDSIETRFNEFGHVPKRWASGNHGEGEFKFDGDLDVDPRFMEDEEYAEWIRVGMWKKKHAEEHAEQLRQQAEREAKRTREKALKAETVRLEKIAEEERRRWKREKKEERWTEARETYDRKWLELLALGEEDIKRREGSKMLKFEDVPWPVFAAYTPKKTDKREKHPPPISLADFTSDAIIVFLLPAKKHSLLIQDAEKEKEKERTKKERKDKLRETMLRFHPDKFEGRVMKMVREDEREKVKDAVGIIVRILGELMGSNG